MSLEITSEERPFDPLKEAVPLPPRPPNLTPRQIRIREYVEDSWQEGKKRFRSLYLDSKAGKALREYQWDRQQHDLLAHEILGDLMGYDDVKKSLRRDLANTKTILGIGVPTGRKGRTRFVYNQMEFVQLLVGFLAWHRAPESRR